MKPDSIDGQPVEEPGKERRRVRKPVMENAAGLEELNRQLLMEINGRKRAEEELEAVREAAIKSSDTKSKFLASMSHEIRTPLNSIIGMSDLLWETPLTKEQREYVRISRRAGDNLLHIINEILDLSRMEAGKIDLEDIDFNTGGLIIDVVDLFAHQAKAKGLNLTYCIDDGVPPDVAGDPNRLKQILLNLVSNAIKFTDSGDVAVRVAIMGRSDKASPPEEKENLESIDAGGGKVELLFSVTDSGIGIPKEKQALIFDSYSQAESSTVRIYGGTGLGITIAKNLLAMMDGDIWVESEEGKGSTFYFTARLGIGKGDAKGESAGSELAGMKMLAVDDGMAKRLPAPVTDYMQDERPLRVLIVDDSADIHYLLQHILKKTACTFDIAENGRVALKKYQIFQYDLILMDLQMPVMNGFEATRAIRKWEEQNGLEKTAIIAMTALAFKGDVEECIEAGCNAHISKPFRPGQLLATVSRFQPMHKMFV